MIISLLSAASALAGWRTALGRNCAGFRSRGGVHHLTEGGKVRLTVHIDCFLGLHPVSQYIRIFEEILLLLHEAGRLFLVGLAVRRFGLDAGESGIDFQALALLKIGEQILINLVLIVYEKGRVQLLIGPVEVIVQLQKHQGRRGLEYVLLGLGVSASVGDKVGEKHLDFRRYPEVHHKVEIGKPIGV